MLKGNILMYVYFKVFATEKTWMNASKLSTTYTNTVKYTDIWLGKKHVHILIRRELPRMLGQVVVLLTCIRKVSGSKLDWDYTKSVFSWFSSVPSDKCRHSFSTGLRVLPSKSFLIRLSFVVLPFDSATLRH
jgi:hypothetical protein